MQGIATNISMVGVAYLSAAPWLVSVVQSGRITTDSLHTPSAVPVCWIVYSSTKLFGSEEPYLIMRASIKKSISSCSEQISGRVCGAQ